MFRANVLGLGGEGDLLNLNSGVGSETGTGWAGPKVGPPNLGPGRGIGPGRTGICGEGKGIWFKLGMLEGGSILAMFGRGIW